MGGNSIACRNGEVGSSTLALVFVLSKPLASCHSCLLLRLLSCCGGARVHVRVVNVVVIVIVIVVIVIVIMVVHVSEVTHAVRCVIVMVYAAWPSIYVVMYVVSIVKVVHVDVPMYVVGQVVHDACRSVVLACGVKH